MLHTPKLKHATYKHMRCVEYMYAQYSIYLLPCCSIHTAYILQYVHTLHMYAVRVLHMHAAYTKIGSAPHACHQAYEECMQFVCNCWHAACMLHITIAHVLHTCIQICATSCACMWHACGTEPIFVYAAHMQHGCIVCAAHVQHICTVCAARKQIYVQHTSNISVRVTINNSLDTYVTGSGKTGHFVQ